MDIEHKKLIGSNGFDGIYAFLDVAGFAEKSIEQLIQLKQQGLRKVYIGMETGNPGLLKKIGKPFTIESLKRAAALLRDSGVATGIILLVGVGGEQWFDRHVNDSIAVVNELDLGKEDAIFLSRLIDAEDGRYGRWVKKAGIRPLDRNRMDEQFNRFLSGFSREDKNSPEVIYYNIEKFIF
ncbi:MAG: hypothetical protein GY940_33700 [bacterium]|nr:hypothetical protein [bacterium]